MNPLLAKLQEYPFERMNTLKAGVIGNPARAHVTLGMGEPRHAPPDFVVEALVDADALRENLRTYPATRGSPALREAIAAWIRQRFKATVDPDSQVLPVAGTREALFSFGQTLFGGKPHSVGVLPNPFYQIYEGAILLGGAEPYYVNTGADSGFLPDYRAVPEDVWSRTELVYLCSPGNPTGRCLDRPTLEWLLDQADRHDFVIAADECYSEIYPDEANPPLGLLEVAAATGRSDYRRCIVFHSLSKRSNLPGLRSGFVAGDADILSRYYLYRTYEGCALGEHVQRVSELAWRDEAHVIANRARYREKFAALTPLLSRAFQVLDPEGGFYHWLDVGGDDQDFARGLFEAEHITVLPGSFLSRAVDGHNPGHGYVRVAWVAELESCIDAATRLTDWALRRTA
ncbi:MAG: succinyldiaminopimelate transaminase [Gammaproteobacteria bacterium]